MADEELELAEVCFCLWPPADCLEKLHEGLTEIKCLTRALTLTLDGPLGSAMAQSDDLRAHGFEELSELLQLLPAPGEPDSNTGSLEAMKAN
eukprot:CAMPEP_0170588290 /NCGR_PEP_ID=MMETSP0224-20130122/10751_1 /TAXON_ID=285029 /ORGANISM="Togula jolla, Strain CCCM 725" /LENGTH=91 /DNA_ID=CAMNT_0010911997 /DNA_START=18 /DNA_END=295 /DNA_ORIENTATION=+